MSSDNKKIRCKVHEELLQRADSENGNWKYNEWARKKNDTIVFCVFCRSNIKCDAKGFQAIVQHSKTIIHKRQIKSVSDPNQLQLFPSPSSMPMVSSKSSATTSTSQIQLISSRESTIRAEIIWTLKSIVSNYSANSCEDIGKVFQAMFPNEPCLKDFRLGWHKVGYLITECLGPHFKDMMLRDLDNSYFTLCFDETTKCGIEKGFAGTTPILFWNLTKKSLSIIWKHFLLKMARLKHS